MKEIFAIKEKENYIFCKRQLIPDVSLEWVFLCLCDAFRDKDDFFFF